MNQSNIGLDKIILFIQITKLWNALAISVRSQVEFVPFLQSAAVPILLYVVLVNFLFSCILLSFGFLFLLGSRE